MGMKRYVDVSHFVKVGILCVIRRCTLLNFIYVLVVSILVTGINLSAIFTASEPSVRQILASSIFLVFWLLFAMYKGINREQSFVKFSMYFWLAGLLLSFAGAVDALRALGVASVFVFTGASYGVLYFVTDGFIGAEYIFYAIIIPFVLAVGGYYLGTMIGKVETVQAQKDPKIK